MTPYRLVVFDWEGTLGDTLGQVLNTIAIEAKRLGFGELDESVAKQYVVLGLVHAIKKMFPRLTLAEYERLLHAVQYALATHPADVPLIPGARQVVEQINQAGMALAIATNKGQQSLQRALQSTGLSALFQLTRSAGQVPAKPCPQMIEELMEACGVSAEQTLMIGDSVSDMEMAERAHVDAIGVDFYHQQETELRAAGALDVFDNYQQLSQYLQL